MNPSADGASVAKPPRLLIIEDEVLIRAMLAEFLRDNGAIVIEAASAVEALDFLETGSEVDLIISDLHMPGAVNGVQMAQRLRSKGITLPIILTSGNPGLADFTALGTFLPKPYEFARLFGLISTLLNLPPTKHKPSP